MHAFPIRKWLERESDTESETWRDTEREGQMGRETRDININMNFVLYILFPVNFQMPRMYCLQVKIRVSDIIQMIDIKQQMHVWNNARKCECLHFIYITMCSLL